MERNIVHMDMDTFFVSVERLRDRSLIGKPVLVGGNSDRAVVASCSYEARQFGVHSAMPMRLAQRLCPDAVIRKGDYDEYSKYSKLVTDILIEKAPLVEKASIDEFYLDLSGMDRFFGCWKWSLELRKKVIRETGLSISMGLSPNKTVSKITTGQAKPAGSLEVGHGMERAFLAPLPANKIPGIGPETYKMLCKMGASHIYHLQALQPELMEATFGKAGIMIYSKANGLDESPVIPYQEQKSVSRSITFERDTTDMNILHKTIIGFVDELGFELRSQQRLTGCVTITIRYADWNTYSRQSQIPYSSTDDVLVKTALQLFEKLYDRRMLVRLVGVKFSDFVSGSYQIDLFSDSVGKINLYQAIDGIKKRFGPELLKKAACL
ncbi:DNA polymerase IV [Chitinophaga oryzae]|uniref:DNA polymerase IV n=1 Tax=Chitinophaga oryzae TaxID=2725414 RepID=A0AAE6ZKG7_9BACT|nr:DNA polymerase IV [Chitinophaga oryzae]QJB34896.1 DNA polymerase IV [Chitinophaga oryzae]QJB41407.1 DNA polymerase IV [Chitinophaga oryzae]